MDTIKIIFFDIDGTLIDMERKLISDKMLMTLKKLKENHIRIGIATGRSPLVIPRFEGVDFDVFLSFNGSYCYNDRQTIFGRPLPKEDVKTIILNGKRMGRHVALATKDRLAANDVDKDLKDYFAIAGLEVPVAPDFDAIAENEDVYQIMAGSREEEYPDLMRGVRASRIAAWWDRAVDIIPEGGGKGVGIERVLAYFGLDRSQAMAFGDGNNDLEMLETVGTGVAMANGSEELKRAADDICPSVSDDGIWQYCLKKGLIA